MKKTTVLVLAMAMVAFLMTPVLAAEGKSDFQTIKKAVKENPNYEPGKEAKWFKVLVTDSKTDKVKVRITLPLSLVEVFARCAENKHLKMNDHDFACDIDLEEMLKELKKVGPMAFIEVYEDDETVKVWIE